MVTIDITALILLLIHEDVICGCNSGNFGAVSES